MKLQMVRAGGAILSFGILVGCTGQIGDVPQSGTGSTSGNASGGSTGTGSGSANGSGSTTGTGSGGTRPATGSGGGTTPSGSGGTPVPGGSGGGSGTAIAPGDPGSLELDEPGKYYRVLRLTNAQWAAAVQTVLNIPSGGLEQNFEGEVTGSGSDFSNNELWLGFDSRNWQDFQASAEALATQVTASSTALAKVYSGTDAAGLITTLGRRAYRRPLTTTEQQAYMTLYTTGAAEATGSTTAFTKGAYLVISAMLQSPNFLFRTELGAKGAPLSGYEMAAKLSLWLRGTSPDDKTLDMAAGTGKLDTADGAATLAQTMLSEAATAKVMRDFHNQWLHLDDYAQVTKKDIPTFSMALPAEFQESSYRFFDNIFAQGLGIKDMLLSTSGFYGPAMAKLYGVTAPAAGAYAQSDLGAKRVGFFSQIPYLTMNGLSNEPNPILRGVSLVRDILCATLGPPAANIPPIPPLQPGQTDRQRIDTLTGSCGSVCHNNMINPLGFAFEHFDGLGQWQDTENGGLQIDSTGSYTFADGTTKTWSDAAGMMQVLASSSQAHTCFAKKLAGFALQRNISMSDMPLLTSLTSASMGSGTNSEKQLILQLVRSDAFRTHGGP